MRAPRSSLIVVALAISSIALSSIASVSPAVAAGWNRGTRLPAPRIGLAAASDADGNIYAIGGAVPLTGTAVDSVFRYDPTSAIWTSVAPLPGPRYWPAAVRGRDGLIYVFGGETDLTGRTIEASAESYDPSTDTWTTLAPMHTPRYGAAAALGRDGLIYVIGGCCGNGPEYDSVEAYDPSTDTWTERSPTPAVGIAFAAAVPVGRRIYVFGGAITGDSTSIVQIYAPANDRWRVASYFMPAARQSLGAASDGNGHVLVFGGFDTDDIFLSSVDVLTVRTKSWTSGPAMPAPRATFGTAAFDGRIHVLGGHSCFTCVEGRNNFILS